MTIIQIDRAIKCGKVVVLSGDPLSRLCYDLFGNLVVISIHNDADPIRLATEEDMKKALVIEHSWRSQAAKPSGTLNIEH